MSEVRTTRKLFLLAFHLVALAVSIYKPAHAATGLDYLVSQQAADGSYVTTATSLATPIQATIESIRAYQSLGQTSQPGYTAALNYLSASTDNDTETLAAKIIIDAGSPVSSVWLTELIGRQNVDGGFGAYAGYASTSLDTAFAVEALSINGQQSELLLRALGRLITTQGADGSFAGTDHHSSVFVTSVVFRALWANRNLSSAVPPVLSKAGEAQITDAAARYAPESSNLYVNVSFGRVLVEQYLSDTEQT